MSKRLVFPQSAVSVAILAGGQSSRMGRDKSQLRLGRQTLLGRIRQTVKKAGFPCRVITRDLVPKCGPLSGILTALKTSQGEGELFLACDMPFITEEILLKLRDRFGRDKKALFYKTKDGMGFPCVLPVSCLMIVQGQIERGEFSLQRLAKACRAVAVRFPASSQSLNVNTPDDLVQAKNLLLNTSDGLEQGKKRARPACKSSVSG